MRNPPQFIRDQHTDIDFSEFPDSDDDCLVQLNMYGASDESKQSPFHMGSVMSVQYKLLKEAFPWLTCAIPYSDQCGDYRSTAATIFNHEMGRLTGLRVKLVLHSEVGDGKGEVDMKFGHKAQLFVAILARLPRTCAADLHQHLELCRYRGDYNLELNISMALFKPGTSGALPYLEQCASVEYLEDGGLILREVYGYGPGIKVEKSTLEPLDHYGVMNVEETGSTATQTSGGKVVPQRRENNGAMGQIAAEMRATAASSKAEVRAQKETETREALAAVEPEAVAKTCEACSGVYQREDTFLRHFTNGACEKKQTRAKEARASQAERMPAAELVKERRAAKKMAERHAASAGQIDVQHFEFNSSEDGRAMILSGDSGAMVVSEVHHDRKLLATRVLPGYTVSRVTDAGLDVTGAMSAHLLMDLAMLSSAARPILVTFAKPLAPMPMRGFARKRFCKPTHVKRTAIQEDFLKSFCATYEINHSEPRSQVVYDAMRKKFGELALDPDTQRPILMSETAIFNWLKARYTAKKTAAVEVAVAAGMATAIAREPEQAQGPTEGRESDESDGGE